MLNQMKIKKFEYDISKLQMREEKIKESMNNKSELTGQDLKSIINVTIETNEEFETINNAHAQKALVGIEEASGLSFDINDIYAAIAVVPLNYCKHLELIKNLVNDLAMFDVHKPCFKCQNTDENWICLTCKQILCSRFINSHMLEHYDEFKHPMVLSFSDISVLCYECEAYIHK